MLKCSVSDHVVKPAMVQGASRNSLLASTSREAHANERQHMPATTTVALGQADHSTDFSQSASIRPDCCVLCPGQKPADPADCDFTWWEQWLAVPIIRPRRVCYPVSALGPNKLTLMARDTGSLTSVKHSVSRRTFERCDLCLVGPGGHAVECSHFVPLDAHGHAGKMPCIVYCHASSGCRLDAYRLLPHLLPYNISLFCLDFSGSGISGGSFIVLKDETQQRIVIVILNYLFKGR